MDITRVNLVLERAIVAFQAEEIEALWEKFMVPTPMQMHKKTGMAVDVTADDAMKAVDAAMSPLTSGHGKLTDPNRTPSRKELVPALNELIEIAKGMRPKDRKEVLARLRGWHKTAQAHAKRMQQAAYSYRVGDVGTGDIQPARNVRDDLGAVISAVSKLRGGGFGKERSRAKPGTGKPRAPKKRDTGGVPSMMDLMLAKDPKEILKRQKAAAMAQAGGKTVPSGTVDTFIRVLEAMLWKNQQEGPAYEYKTEIKKGISTIRNTMKPEMGSEDHRDLKDLVKVTRRAFGGARRSGVMYTIAITNVVDEWAKQVERFIKSGAYPVAPPGTMVVPKRDKRQMAMKFEALKRLRLALAG